MNYYVRGTFTHNNLDFSKDVLHLADLGFKQISVEPVVAQPTDDYAIREEDLPILKEEYDKLAVEMIKRKKEGKAFNFFHFMIDLQGGPCVAKRLSGCGSGTEYLAVTPWGDLYPCHQFVGNEKFLMGNVDTGVVRDDIRDEFKCCNIYAKDKCKKCLPSSIAAADVLRTPIISMAISMMRMTSAVSCRESVSNVLSC